MQMRYLPKVRASERKRGEKDEKRASTESERNRGKQIATGRLRSPAEKVRFGNVTAVIVPD